jgi:probable phosphoglycerate mutase
MPNDATSAVLTQFILIRHGATDTIGQCISGRRSGNPLNAEGKLQAEEVAAELRRFQISAVYASPMERTRETARIIATALQLSAVTSDSLAEIEYGDWTGRPFSELANIAEWRLFNRFRSHARVPGGEMMVEVQSRVVAEMLRLEQKHRGASVALVSHADVIRSAVGYYAGIPIDLLHRIVINLASVSIVAIGERDAQVLCVNALTPFFPKRPDQWTAPGSKPERSPVSAEKTWRNTIG